MATGKAAVFYAPGKPFEIRDVTIPEIEPEAILIKVSLANICGSDLHFWRGDAPLRIPGSCRRRRPGNGRPPLRLSSGAGRGDWGLALA